LYLEDFEYDEGSDHAINTSPQIKTSIGTLTNWLVEEQNTDAPRRLHMHFLHDPVEIVGGTNEEDNNKVVGIKFERNELDGTGNVRGTGDIIEYPVQAVGYTGTELPDVGFDLKRGVIPNERGRVLNTEGNPI